VFVGVFQTPIIQCRPLAWTIVETRQGLPGQYTLTAVPPGHWYVRAVAAADSTDPEPWTRRSLMIGGQGPVRMSPSAPVVMDIALRPRRRSDLPILFAVPDLEPRDTDPEGGEPPALTADTQPALLAAAGS
jgi:AraC family transcriptional regulator